MTHEQITAAARDPQVPTIPVADIIGPGEIRKMAGGVTRKTLMTWRERPDFPPPVKSLGIGDLFDRRAVQAWLKAEGR
jgi:hypothetical protein